MNKYVILLIALLVYLVLAWFAGSWIGLQGSDLWILRVGLAVIGIAAAATIAWFCRKQDRQAAASAGEQQTAGLPEHEIDAAFRAAQSKLKSSTTVQNRRLAELPIVLVVGDVSSCKTSVVAHSGLEPELLAGQAYEDNAIVPTRSLNLWFARNVAFVETGGKLQNDKHLWSALLRRLQTTRVRALLSAAPEAPRVAVVCVSCEDLLQSGGDHHVALARTLRARLDAITGALGIQLPVYVLATKSDRVSFFSEYTRNLTNEEASRVLGATLPIEGGRQSGVYAETATQNLNVAFDNLILALCDRRPDLLNREHDPEKLPGIYEFPRELRKLRSPLVQFLIELCKPTQLGAAPFLRGFYFTGVRATFVSESVRQAPAQIQPKASATAAEATRFFKVGESPAVQPGAAAAQLSRKVPQWVFLSHFFSDVLLQDRAAMGTSSGSLKTATLKRVVLASASALCLLLSLALIISFVANRRIASEMADSARTVTSSPATAETGVGPLSTFQSLEQFRAALERLGVYRTQGAPLHMRWGLYAGNRFYAAGRAIYFDRFRRLIFADAQNALANDLKRLPATPGPNSEYGITYDALKAYLITTANHDKSSASFLSPVLLRYWISGRTVDTERSALAQKQVDFYSEELREANPYSADYDKAAVERARQYLSQFAGTERVYQFMLAEAAKKFPSINFNRQFAGSAQFVLAAKEVNGAYSKAGWSFMNDAIKNSDRFFSGEEWVLGNSAGAALDKAQIEQTLRERYTAGFIQQWREFLQNANVVRYANIKDAAQKLTMLSGNQSPLLALFWTVSQNTGVQSPEIQSAFQPVQFVVPPESVDRYISEKNSSYVNALVTLQAQLEQLANSPGGTNDAMAGQAASTALQAKVVTRQLSQNFKIDSQGHVETTVQKLMEDPITYAEGLVRNLGPAELNAKGKTFCTQLRDLAAKAPFTPTASQQASLQDFNGIFQPMQGALWTFYDLNLKSLLVRQGTQFVPSPNATVRVDPGFVAFWNRITALSDAVYPNNSPQPRLPFSIKLQQVEAIENLTLSIDDQSVKASDRASKQLVWTPAGRSEVKLTGRFGSGPELAFADYEGPWALFQFFADADRWTSQGSVHTLTWMLRQGKAGRPLTLSDGRAVTLDFELDMGKAPPFFQKGYLSTIGCVADIAKP
jgi:type VI secretion system protein ImpL